MQPYVLFLQKEEMFVSFCACSFEQASNLLHPFLCLAKPGPFIFFACPKKGEIFAKGGQRQIPLRAWTVPSAEKEDGVNPKQGRCRSKSRSGLGLCRVQRMKTGSTPSKSAAEANLAQGLDCAERRKGRRGQPQARPLPKQSPEKDAERLLFR